MDTPCFYNKVADVIENFEYQSCILCGDFNLIQNFKLDPQNYVNINNPRSRQKVLNIKENYNLVDPLESNILFFKDLLGENGILSSSLG